MSRHVPIVAAARFVAAALFVVGCEQTSSSPTGTLAPGTTNHSQTQTPGGVVHDARGDSNSPAPYMDVVHAKITQQGDGLFFMMVLAGPIPERPSEPDLIWPFHVDTDRTAFPGGLYNEYVVRVRWINGAFVGQVVNRRPLLQGGSPVVTAVPFSIDDNAVKVFVPSALLGGPVSFEWNASTRPGQAANYVDFAPDDGLAAWTQ